MITKSIYLLAIAYLFCGALAFSQTGHIHELYYNNSQWVDTDLSSIAGGPGVHSFSAITAFSTPGQQLHVYYQDVNGHIHQLYFNTSTWSDQDLTAITGGPSTYGEALSGFAVGNLQHVFYEGSDNHIHQLYYNNSNWSDQDITAAAGGPAASAAFVSAFATTPNHQFHVYYQPTQTLDLHQLYFNGTSWSDSDLTSITGGYCYTDWLVGLATGNLQHILCPGYGSQDGLDLHLHHIYYNNNTWLDEDVSQKFGLLPLALGSAVAAFQVPGQTQGEVYDVSGDNHIHQTSYFNGHWSDVDLTTGIGAPAYSGFGGAVGFATTPNKQFQIYYQPSSEVFQLYFDGSKWTVNDLTGGVGKATQNSGMAGFALGNLQHVYYVANAN